MRTALLLGMLLVVSTAQAASKATLSAKTLDGDKANLKDLRGSLVVLNFWATWCLPCREEMPLLSGAHELHFIAVSVDDAKTQPKIADAVKQYGISFPVWKGASGDDVFRLSKGEAVPTTIFIDRDGNIQAVVSGQIRAAELTERLDWLTGERKGSKPEAVISHIN
jgi:cytochrome c biogenesis protein CcmG/thiol:disulfide interchange protein DsbE